MNFLETAKPMTAVRMTRNVLTRIDYSSLAIVPDDDPIFNDYLVHLEEEKTMTFAPADEFPEVFRFVNGEIKDEFAPIERI